MYLIPGNERTSIYFRLKLRDNAMCCSHGHEYEIIK